jgi:hypothetical protein
VTDVGHTGFYDRALQEDSTSVVEYRSHGRESYA